MTSDVHFVTKRGLQTEDDALENATGVSSDDVIAAVKAVRDGTAGSIVAAVATDTIWDAADDLLRGTGPDAAERFPVAASRIVGKASSGKVRDLTAAEVKTILGIGTSDVSGLDEQINDRIGAVVTAGIGVTVTNDDAANTVTIASTASALDTTKRFGGAGETAIGATLTIDIATATLFILTQDHDASAITLSCSLAATTLLTRSATFMVFQPPAATFTSFTITNSTKVDADGVLPTMPSDAGKWLTFTATYDGTDWYIQAGAISSRTCTAPVTDLWLPATKAAYPEKVLCTGTVVLDPAGVAYTVTPPALATECIAFDGNVDTFVEGTIDIPENYETGGTIRVQFLARSSTAGNILLVATTAKMRDATDNLLTKNSAWEAFNTSGVLPIAGTAGLPSLLSITLTGSYVPFQRVGFLLGRPGLTNASDTSALTIYVPKRGITFEYIGQP